MVRWPTYRFRRYWSGPAVSRDGGNRIQSNTRLVTPGPRKARRYILAFGWARLQIENLGEPVALPLPRGHT